MSNPLFAMAIHALTGVLLAVLIPFGVVLFGIEYLKNPAPAFVLVPIIIFVLMSITVAALAISEYVPDEMPMGPSLMLGFGILNLGFLVVPFLFMPGLVWLYVLPFDIQGRSDWDSWVGLDWEAVEKPNHRK